MIGDQIFPYKVVKRFVLVSSQNGLLGSQVNARISNPAKMNDFHWFLVNLARVYERFSMAIAQISLGLLLLTFLDATHFKSEPNNAQNPEIKQEPIAQPKIKPAVKTEL